MDFTVECFDMRGVDMSKENDDMITFYRGIRDDLTSVEARITAARRDAAGRGDFATAAQLGGVWNKLRRASGAARDELDKRGDQ